MNNIIFFPRKTIATAIGRKTSRSALIAVWRRNPDSGRLECHWQCHGIVERVPFHDEGPRAGAPDRQVA